MISEKQFSTLYTSFWQELIPTGEAFVRTINLAKHHYTSPMQSHSDPARRGIINEIGFLLFVSSVNSGIAISDVFESAELANACKQAWQLAQNYLRGSEEELPYPSTEEQYEGYQLASRIADFFANTDKSQEIVTTPTFSGCGFVDKCVGDLLVGDTLYEVKAGDRGFRLVDIKQLLTYLALNSSTQTYVINNMGLLNPRLGTSYSTSIADFIAAMSGRNKVEVLADIIEYISSGGVSR